MVLILIQMFVFSVWSSFLPGRFITDGGYGITNFVLLYFIAAYLRMYGIPQGKITLAVSGYFVCAFITFLFSLGGPWVKRAYNYDFVFNIIGSVCLFVFFLKLNLGNKRGINVIAKSTFGVFLIHTDFALKDIIWHKWLSCEAYYNSNLFVLHFVGTVIILFVISAIIELLRMYLIKWLSTSIGLEERMSKCFIEIK